MMLDRIEHVKPSPARQSATSRRPFFRLPPDAASRFAAACGTLPGALVLHDVALDEVSLSFGARTQEVHDRLHALGCRVKLSGWGPQKVLRFAFSGHNFGDDLAQELADVVDLALGEMHVAETRQW